MARAMIKVSVGPGVFPTEKSARIDTAQGSVSMLIHESNIVDGRIMVPVLLMDRYLALIQVPVDTIEGRNFFVPIEALEMC